MPTSASSAGRIIGTGDSRSCEAACLLSLRRGALLLTGWPIVSHICAPPTTARWARPFRSSRPISSPRSRRAQDALEANRRDRALQRQMQEQAVASVRRPKPVDGMTPATVRREWLFDPSIVTEDDIVDAKGNLIAARGTRVNPLDMVQLRQALVFVDGDNAAELAWAVRRPGAISAKIIFVSGSPFDAMKPRQRRLLFRPGRHAHAQVRHPPHARRWSRPRARTSRSASSRCRRRRRTPRLPGGGKAS
jgi:conjugal transfer pilus assembly protein TraW